LRFPFQSGRPYVVGNFVSTLDGVVTLGVPGHLSSGEISGRNEQDHMLMGLLRAAADVVVVGAGTLRAVPTHVWTADFICPSLAAEYRALRFALHHPGPAPTALVTASGRVDLSLPVFTSGRSRVLILTTNRGAKTLSGGSLLPGTRVVEAGDGERLTPTEILEGVRGELEPRLSLLEGGPHLLGEFLAGGVLDELFLTIAPQVAGRDHSPERLGFVEGRRFAPDHPLWGDLVSIRRGGSHIFLRYGFGA
jgi:riboflavin biosynthesis pyrimidine reductase